MTAWYKICRETRKITVNRASLYLLYQLSRRFRANLKPMNTGRGIFAIPNVSPQSNVESDVNPIVPG